MPTLPFRSSARGFMKQVDEKKTDIIARPRRPDDSPNLPSRRESAVWVLLFLSWFVGQILILTLPLNNSQWSLSEYNKSTSAGLIKVCQSGSKPTCTTWWDRESVSNWVGVDAATVLFVQGFMQFSLFVLCFVTTLLGLYCQTGFRRGSWHFLRFCKVPSKWGQAGLANPFEKPKWYCPVPNHPRFQFAFFIAALCFDIGVGIGLLTLRITDSSSSNPYFLFFSVNTLVIFIYLGGWNGCFLFQNRSGKDTRERDLNQTILGLQEYVKRLEKDAAEKHRKQLLQGENTFGSLNAASDLPGMNIPTGKGVFPSGQSTITLVADDSDDAKSISDGIDEVTVYGTPPTGIRSPDGGLTPLLPMDKVAAMQKERGKREANISSAEIEERAVSPEQQSSYGQPPPREKNKRTSTLRNRKTRNQWKRSEKYANPLPVTGRVYLGSEEMSFLRADSSTRQAVKAMLAEIKYDDPWSHLVELMRQPGDDLNAPPSAESLSQETAVRYLTIIQKAQKKAVKALRKKRRPEARRDALMFIRQANRVWEARNVDLHQIAKKHIGEGIDSESGDSRRPGMKGMAGRRTSRRSHDDISDSSTGGESSDSASISSTSDDSFSSSSASSGFSSDSSSDATSVDSDESEVGGRKLGHIGDAWNVFHAGKGGFDDEMFEARMQEFRDKDVPVEWIRFWEEFRESSKKGRGKNSCKSILKKYGIDGTGQIRLLRHPGVEKLKVDGAHNLVGVNSNKPATIDETIPIDSPPDLDASASATDRRGSRRDRRDRIGRGRTSDRPPVTYPDGTAPYPGGPVTYPGGTAPYPGGPVTYPAGTAPYPGGPVTYPGGTAPYPGGPVTHPGGTAPAGGAPTFHTGATGSHTGGSSYTGAPSYAGAPSYPHSSHEGAPLPYSGVPSYGTTAPGRHGGVSGFTSRRGGGGAPLRSVFDSPAFHNGDPTITSDGYAITRGSDGMPYARHKSEMPRSEWKRLNNSDGVYINKYGGQQDSRTRRPLLDQPTYSRGYDRGSYSPDYNYRHPAGMVTDGFNDYHGPAGMLQNRHDNGWALPHSGGGYQSLSPYNGTLMPNGHMLNSNGAWSSYDPAFNQAGPYRPYNDARFTSPLFNNRTGLPLYDQSHANSLHNGMLGGGLGGYGSLGHGLNRGGVGHGLPLDARALQHLDHNNPLLNAAHGYDDGMGGFNGVHNGDLQGMPLVGMGGHNGNMLLPGNALNHQNGMPMMLDNGSGGFVGQPMMGMGGPGDFVGFDPSLAGLGHNYGAFQDGLYNPSLAQSAPYGYSDQAMPYSDMGSGRFLDEPQPYGMEGSMPLDSGLDAYGGMGGQFDADPLNKMGGQYPQELLDEDLTGGDYGLERPPGLDYGANDIDPMLNGKEGYGANGYDANGYDPSGYNADGYDPSGYNADGYNADGYNADGYNADGYNGDGYNANGYDADGYDADGFDPDGLDANGLDANGELGAERYDPDGNLLQDGQGLGEQPGGYWDENGEWNNPAIDPSANQLASDQYPTDEAGQGSIDGDYDGQQPAATPGEGTEQPATSDPWEANDRNWPQTDANDLRQESLPDASTDNTKGGDFGDAGQPNETNGYKGDGDQTAMTGAGYDPNDPIAQDADRGFDGDSLQEFDSDNDPEFQDAQQMHDDPNAEHFDDQGRRIDDQGRPIDEDGNLIDENGRLIDEEGNFIDQDGRHVDEDGYLIDDEGRPIDEEGNLLPVDDDGRVIEEALVDSFACGMCGDEFLETEREDIIELDECGHRFCSRCWNEHVNDEDERIEALKQEHQAMMADTITQTDEDSISIDPDRDYSVRCPTCDVIVDPDAVHHVPLTQIADEERACAEEESEFERTINIPEGTVVGSEAVSEEAEFDDEEPMTSDGVPAQEGNALCAICMRPVDGLNLVQLITEETLCRQCLGKTKHPLGHLIPPERAAEFRQEEDVDDDESDVANQANEGVDQDQEDLAQILPHIGLSMVLWAYRNGYLSQPVDREDKGPPALKFNNISGEHEYPVSSFEWHVGHSPMGSAVAAY